MWLLALALATADECAITAQVDEAGKLVYVDRGTCPPWFQIQLQNSVGQDEPLPLPEHTLVQLPVTIDGRAAYLGPATEGRVVGPHRGEGPDVSHLAERVLDLPPDCELLATVDPEGRIDSISPVDCAISDYQPAQRRARRARFESGADARLPGPLAEHRDLEDEVVPEPRREPIGGMEDLDPE